MPPFVNLVGQKFGELTVIENAGYSCSGHTNLWICKCSCGNFTTVRGTNLKSHHTISCGCKKGKTIHNKWNTRLYRIYQNMKQRCYNPKNKWYKNYGQRGITINKDWLDDFMNFYNWAINNGYSEELTLDRINVNGNYEPDNCRWATKIQQQNNMRSNKFITYKNESHTIHEWERIFNLPSSYLRSRLRSNKFEDIIKKLGIS